MSKILCVIENLVLTTSHNVPNILSNQPTIKRYIMKGHKVRDEKGELVFIINHSTLLSLSEHLEKKWQGNKFIITKDQALMTNHGKLYLWEGYTIDTNTTDFN